MGKVVWFVLMGILAASSVLAVFSNDGTLINRGCVGRISSRSGFNGIAAT